MTLSSLIAAALASTFVAPAPQSAKLPAPDAQSLHGFSVTLVLGQMQGDGTPDALLPGAKKALADMRSFLPYKSYRALDTQWILCCGAAKFPTSFSGRLRGVDEQEYTFGVAIINMTGPQLTVRFSMSADAKKLPSSKGLESPGSPDAGSAGTAPRAEKMGVMDTTFSIDVGETVVIGTSTLKGDKALIALLTAAPRPGTTK